MDTEEHIFIGHDGKKIINDTEFYFTKHFDWVFMNNMIIKRKFEPNTCYIKTDYLDKYIDDILGIKNKFILVSGCSDFSPSIHYKKSYEKIIEIPNLIKYYAENNLSNHVKMSSLTVGLATHDTAYERKLLEIRQTIGIKKNKIFCCFRQRRENCCGDKFVERQYASLFINNHQKYIDYYDNLNNNDFLTNLSQCKWCFCPLGNGVDHSPKLLECLILKTIPICKINFNSYSLYKKYPIIWIEDFNEVLKYDELKYPTNFEWDKIIEDFNHKNVYDKICSELTSYVKSYDIIITVIASRGNIYDQLIEQYWVPFIKFINIHYTNVHVILMFGNDFDKSGLSLEDANIFCSKHNDSYIPGIFDKTLDCFEYIISNYNFKHIIRTNLSSFLIIQNLIEISKSMKYYNIYAGVLGRLGKNHSFLAFCSGACFWLTKDIVKLLIDKKDHPERLKYHDDVIVSLILKDIPRTELPRFDLMYHNVIPDKKLMLNIISKTHYHIRLRNDNDRNFDVEHMRFFTEIMYSLNVS
tara:strand:- start:117 stop:1691 length:1575 start_codon:yes stop_codon:yes gene_type:complete